MEIISSRGELKLLTSEVTKLNPQAVTEQTSLYGSLYTYAASRTAGQSATISYSGGSSNCNAVRIPQSYTRLYVPQEGWYLANLELTTTTMTAHYATLQIHSSRIGVFFVYKKFNLPAASFGFPTIISITGLTYMYPEDYFSSFWGSTQAISADLIRFKFQKL